MNSQWRNIAIGSPFIISPTTIQSLTLMGWSSFLPPKRLSPLSPLISQQWNPRSSGQSGSLLPGSYPGTHRLRYGRYSHYWSLSLQSSSCPPVFLISCYVVRFVLVATFLNLSYTLDINITTLNTYERRLLMINDSDMQKNNISSGKICKSNVFSRFRILKC